jgi:hypothetical protein
MKNDGLAIITKAKAAIAAADFRMLDMLCLTVSV